MTENQKYAKTATKHSISIVEVNVNAKNLNYRKIKKCLQLRYSSIGIIINTKCFNFENIMLYASKNMLFNAPRKWLMFDLTDQHVNNSDCNKMIDPFCNECMKEINKPTLTALSKLNLSVDADIIMAMQGSHKLSLFEVFNYGKIQGGNLKILYIGDWTTRKKLDLSYITKYKYYRRWNFEQLNLRMVAVVSSQAKDFKYEYLNSVDTVAGVSVFTRISSIILHVISDIHNISYKYKVVDRWIGNYLQNSTPSVSRSLYFREQDISPVLRMDNSVGYVDFVYPSVTSIETRFYYRIPTRGPGKFENQFLRPLSTGAWFCVLAVCVLCVFVLMMSSKLERRQSSVQYAVFSVVASICQQFFEDSSEVALRRITAAGKMTILVTGISCVLIYNYYTSSVVSWLLSGPPPSINSLKELLESPLELTFEDVGYTRSWLQLPNYYYNKRNAKVEDELKQRKVFNKKGGPLLVPIEKGIGMVKDGGYAYHTEVYSANTLISRTFNQYELCELGSLKSIDKTLLFVSVQRDSPYKEFFVWSLLRLFERGIVSCIQGRTGAPDVSCEGRSPRALALGGAAPAFILLGTGYLLGIVVMVMERLVYPLKP
ncbi:ionotropic receptor 75a-like [Battus philenor]|uniref:ionotropic receptor 75a-like n=1 Tax=Battus philenor TaxID=42288 RepID=UPI0035CF9072